MAVSCSLLAWRGRSWGFIILFLLLSLSSSSSRASFSSLVFVRYSEHDLLWNLEYSCLFLPWLASTFISIISEVFIVFFLILHSKVYYLFKQIFQVWCIFTSGYFSPSACFYTHTGLWHPDYPGISSASTYSTWSQRRGWFMAPRLSKLLDR